MTLVFLAVAFAVGILAGHFLRSEAVFACTVPAWFFPSLVAALLALLLLLRHRATPALCLGIVLFFVLGGWRYVASPFDHRWTERELAFYQADEGVWGTVEGEVIAFPDVEDRVIRYQLAVERVAVGGQEHAVAGRAMVEAPRYPGYAYGDTLRVSGLLLTPPTSDGFDYRRFLAIRNIHTLVRRPTIERTASGGGEPFWRVLYGVRSYGAAVINRAMPEPAAGLTSGMVLGIEGGISDEINAAFEATGTSHLIVISGSNIALLAGALVAALGRVLSRRRAALAAAPFLVLYVLLVGADPPALRAGVMGLLTFGAVLAGRRGTAYVSLCAAGLVMLALNPLTLWDIGFQLSFMTSLGLILFSRPLSSALLASLRKRLPTDVARRWTGFLEATLIVTVAAQVAVLPLIVCYFGRLSPVSLLANALVLPVQPAVLAGGVGAMLAGAVWQPLGQLVAVVPGLLLTYTAGVLRGAADLPYASLDTGRAGPPFVVAYYILLALVVGSPRILRALQVNPDLRRASAWVAVLVAPAAFAFFAWRAKPDDRLHVVFLAHESAEAAVIVAPGGHTAWLWDGRGEGEALVAATRSGGWVRGKPEVVLTDCGLNPWPGSPCIDTGELFPGSAVALSEELRLTRLSTNGPPAVLLSYGDLRVLLPSTLPPDAQESIGEVAPVTLMKAPGPGTGTWPTLGYLRILRPQLVLWPLETTYPPEVAEYLARAVSTTRVESEAAVEVVSDGQRLWVVRHSATPPH